MICVFFSVHGLSWFCKDMCLVERKPGLLDFYQLASILLTVCYGFCHSFFLKKKGK